MATLKDQIPEGTVATHADGRKAYFRNGKWNIGDDPSAVNIDRTAPGAAFLPQMRSPGSKSEEAYFRKVRETDNGGLANARKSIEASRQMEDLMERQETGGKYAIPVIGPALGLFDPEIRSMNKLSAEQARLKRQPGEGAVSDFDAQQFLNMAYGADKPTETNKLIIRAQRLADDATIQRRQFQEWHYNKFGTLSGAEEAWDRYAQDNPIFKQDEGGAVANALNDGRKNWREYFGDVRAPQDTLQTAAAADARRAAAPRVVGPAGLPKKPQAATGWTVKRRD